MTNNNQKDPVALLRRARNHIIDWWRPDGELPPARSPDLVEDIDDYLASIKDQQAHGAMPTELGYLIEVVNTGNGPLWVTAKNEFTKDANSAIRFSRRCDAEDFLKIVMDAKFGTDIVGIYKRHLGKDCYSVTEHLWYNAAPQAPASKEVVEYLPTRETLNALHLNLKGVLQRYADKATELGYENVDHALSNLTRCTDPAQDQCIVTGETKITSVIGDVASIKFDKETAQEQGREDDSRNWLTDID